ncbi:TrmB family transcriptional regulator [Sphingomonas sp. Leaf343]|uniref:TrmB family transcriptional regulator n=1 Tax=Sphingomonas sp. Leaf343 TaxID=1736345 RepID=UPI0006F59A4A|nr:TrmB family transcriptional regulator [Sphingomonas sp. Leaf343]KQR87378.1 hypothetical protein ASG07_00065 [Sphingomonas sp. Leaf343]
MDANSALCGFGFTQLEALIYAELLRSAPSTGYRLARDVGKAPPNIYQTLKGLVEKGAIVAAEDAESATSYFPVPPRQLFAAIKDDFAERHHAALTILEAIHAPTAHESVYQLRNVKQVFERALAMIEAADEIILFDMMPPISARLRPAIDQAAQRGVKVVGIAYRPEDAAATIPYNGEKTSDVESRWPGLGLILIIDGREQLIAQLTRDMENVLNAVYSDSVFLSSVLHSAVSSDIRLVALRADATDPLADLTLTITPPPGLRDLQTDVPAVAG